MHSWSINNSDDAERNISRSPIQVLTIPSVARCRCSNENRPSTESMSPRLSVCLFVCLINLYFSLYYSAREFVTKYKMIDITKKYLKNKAKKMATLFFQPIQSQIGCLLCITKKYFCAIFFCLIKQTKMATLFFYYTEPDREFVMKYKNDRYH